MLSWIAEFRFLKRLILVHGRYSYNRTAFLSQYSFYKSLLICFIQILWVLIMIFICLDCLWQKMFLFFCSCTCTGLRSFSFISGVSGTSLFNSVSLMAYNVFYTSVPVLVSALDKDLSERTVMQHPQILFYCQAGRFAVSLLFLINWNLMANAFYFLSYWGFFLKQAS